MVVSRRKQEWISPANNSLNLSFLGDDVEYKVWVYLEGIIGSGHGGGGGVDNNVTMERRWPCCWLMGGGGGGDEEDKRLSWCQTRLLISCWSQGQHTTGPKGACVCLQSNGHEIQLTVVCCVETTQCLLSSRLFTVPHSPLWRRCSLKITRKKGFELQRVICKSKWVCWTFYLLEVCNENCP